MNGSIEMKLQAIDKMIDMRNQLITMQENLNMSTGVDFSNGVLVHSLKDLQELAEATGNEIHETEYVPGDGWKEVAFEYKEISLHTFLTQDEYEAYKSENESGGKDE